MKKPLLLFAPAIFFLQGFPLPLAGCGGNSAPAVPIHPESSIPVNGPGNPDAARIDGQVIPLMSQYDVPGMTLSITKNGRLIFTRGYGYANREMQETTQPDTRGRIGSISKTITAVAVLHLAEQGKLNLDMPFLQILTPYSLPPSGDQRIRTITVRYLLHHTGGWDTSISGDPEMMATEIANALGVPDPSNCGDWIQYKLTRPLDFEPGSKFSYSNFGFCVLGRIVQKVSGQNYYDYVRNEILAPMQIRGIATAYTLESRRQLGEMKYYDYPGAGLMRSALPPHNLAPAPYGWAQMEALEGFGGWIASSIDLTRFMNSIDGTGSAHFLADPSVQQFIENPHVPTFSSTDWYGLGIVLVPVSGGGLYWYHNGGCPGTTALLAHRPDGYDWAVVVNTAPSNSGALLDALHQKINGLIDPGMSDSGDDLYNRFPSIP